MGVTARYSHDRTNCDGTFTGSASVSNNSNRRVLVSIHVDGIYECTAEVAGVSQGALVQSRAVLDPGATKAVPVLGNLSDPCKAGVIEVIVLYGQPLIDPNQIGDPDVGHEATVREIVPAAGHAVRLRGVSVSSDKYGAFVQARENGEFEYDLLISCCAVGPARYDLRWDQGASANVATSAANPPAANCLVTQIFQVTGRLQSAEHNGRDAYRIVPAAGPTCSLSTRVKPVPIEEKR
jgi:hypothetical protein